MSCLSIDFCRLSHKSLTIRKWPSLQSHKKLDHSHNSREWCCKWPSGRARPFANGRTFMGEPPGITEHDHSGMVKLSNLSGNARAFYANARAPKIRPFANGPTGSPIKSSTIPGNGRAVWSHAFINAWAGNPRSRRGSLQGGKNFDSNFLCLLCVSCNSKQLSK